MSGNEVRCVRSSSEERCKAFGGQFIRWPSLVWMTRWYTRFGVRLITWWQTVARVSPRYRNLGFSVYRLSRAMPHLLLLWLDCPRRFPEQGSCNGDWKFVLWVYCIVLHG